MNYQELLELKRQLATNLKAVRTAAKVSQNELADSILVSVNTIKDMEDIVSFRHHSFFNIIKVSKYFNISIDELLHGKSDEMQHTQLLYKIKKLTPVRREMIEAYLLKYNQ